jgi:dTDP-glucose 4,6-dehydratase
MITNALLERPLPVYGQGNNVRDWLFVDDHARALCAIVENGKPGESYNIGGRAELSNVAVVHAICDHLDKLKPREDGGSYRDTIQFVSDRPGHDFRYAINPEKIERKIGWRATETFETGLDKTIRWYLNNSAWWLPLRQTRYDGRRLGLVPERMVS